LNSSKQAHELHKLIIDSYNKSIENGMSIFDWVNNIRKLGCVVFPNPKSMMLASMGRCIPPERHKFNFKNFVLVKTNSFGNIYVPKELAFKVLVMNFFPI
jgi:hypothetical protein